MILKKAVITNFRGINGSITVNFDLFNCIVGQNDAGKSTILKALDASLNETTLSRADYNVQAQDNQIIVELFFDCKNKQYLLGEEILTTIEDEELTKEEQLEYENMKLRIENELLKKGFLMKEDGTIVKFMK